MIECGTQITTAADIVAGKVESGIADTPEAGVSRLKGAIAKVGTTGMPNIFFTLKGTAEDTGTDKAVSKVAGCCSCFPTPNLSRSWVVKRDETMNAPLGRSEIE